MASSAATLRPTKLERDLSRCDVPLTDRQQRLVTDLRMLRQLFQKVWMTLYLFGLGFLYRPAVWVWAVYGMGGISEGGMRYGIRI